MKTPLKKGETVSKDVDSMMALKWMDKRPVLMLSNDSFVTKKRRSRRARGHPEAVEEYNKNMGSVNTGKKYTQCDVHVHLCTDKT